MPSPTYKPNRTLAADNQFTFSCPIFHATTKIAACFELRDIFAVGQRPAVRRGCQVAMECGKCPISTLSTMLMHKDIDIYHATDTKLRELDDDLLDRIAPVLIREEVIRHYELTDAEAAKLRDANANATPAGARRSTSKKAKKLEAPIEPVAADTSTVAAAKSGDMTAAVNAAIKAGV